MALITALALAWSGPAWAQSDELDAAYKQCQMLDKQGKYAEAIPFAQTFIKLTKKEFGEAHANYAAGLINLAELYANQSQYADAEPLFKRALAIQVKALGPEHPGVAVSLDSLGFLYSNQGRHAVAEPLYKRSLAINEKALGPDHPDVAISLGNLAFLYGNQGRYADALPFIRRVTTILRRRGIDGASGKSVGAESERKSGRWYFLTHASLAIAVSRLNPSQSAALHDEAFEVIQLAQTSSAASALSQMAARLGAGDEALARTVRSQQDLLGSWRSLDKKLIAELSKPKGARSPDREARLCGNLSKTDARLDALDRELAEKFPQYTELASPQPLKAADARKLLGTDEALVVYNGSFAWILRHDGFRMLELDINRKKLEAAVTKLRASFTPVKGKVPGFPYGVAHDLYQKIFVSVEVELSGIRHVMVVPDGPLTSLPLSVLVRSPYTGKGKPEWLAEKYALTTLPSVSSLRALRFLAQKAGPGTDSFAGFGNPVLKGDPSDRRGISIVTIFSKGDKADPNALRRMPALPETEDELKAIARSLGAGEETIYLKERATETQVKLLDLSKTNVVAFATHGLIAGKLWGLAEPGLVLTPPMHATRIECQAVLLDASWDNRTPAV
jgi:tetratricopeptide (TPR) repeat protein